MYQRLAATGVTVQVILSAPNDTARSTLLKGASVSEIFCHVMVEDCICLLNIIVTALFTGTPVAPFAGALVETVGGVADDAVNENEYGEAIEFQLNLLHQLKP